MRVLRFPITVSIIYAFSFLLKKKPELGAEVKVLKGNRMTSKTRKTGPCNYCVVKCKVLLDCPLFSCLLAELKAHWVGEGCTLLVTGAEGLLTTRRHLSRVNGSCLTLVTLTPSFQHHKPLQPQSGHRRESSSCDPSTVIQEVACY